MQRTFECSVCSEFYVPGTRPPKTLTCGHSFCAPCLHILYKDATLHCPKCRTTCTIPSNNIASLPTTYSILEMLDSVCGECHNQSHSGKCGHCDKNVCDPCREEHIAASQSDISADYDTLKDLVQQLNDTLADDQPLKAIATRRDKVIKELTKLKDEQIRMIEKSFDEKVAKVKATAQEDLDKRLQYNDVIGKTLVEARKLLETIRKQQYSISNDDDKSAETGVEDMIKNINDLKMPDPPMSTMDCSYNREDLAAYLSDSFILMIKTPSGVDVTDCDLTSTAAPDCSKMKLKKVLKCPFEVPEGVCINPTTGDIIVTDFGNDKIYILNESLDLLHSFEAVGINGSCDGPFGVACDGEHIYIADFCNDHICVTDVQGNMVQVFGSRGSGKGEFSCPRGLALDPTGHLYVCDGRNHRAQVLSKQGVFIREFGEGVFGDKEPRHIAVSSDNKIAVTDRMGNLYLFTTSGQHIRTIPSTTAPYNLNATAVVFDGHNNILLSEEQNDCVISISQTGERRSCIDTKQGELKDPRGLAIVRNNDIVVCDTGNGRIVLLGCCI